MEGYSNTFIYEIGSTKLQLSETCHSFRFYLNHSNVFPEI